MVISTYFLLFVHGESTPKPTKMQKTNVQQSKANFNKCFSFSTCFYGDQ